jgi:hypothetical protein
MKGKFLLLCCLISLQIFAQNDSTGNANVSSQKNKKKWPGDETALRIFYSQRLISAKTVEVLPKGAMAFTIVHTFGNIAAGKDAHGKPDGGTYTFFGLDEISDAQIGFQIGLTNRLNILLQHTVGVRRGQDWLQHFWEAGLKNQFLKQGSNGSPISLTAFGNIVSTAEKLDTATHNKEAAFQTGADRLSELFQVMIARRFGNVSLQLSGTYLHTHLVIPGDQNDLFSIGGAVRLPLTKSVFIIADYFHSFRKQESIDAWKAESTLDVDQTPRDVFGIGAEILTAGHVFHLNFTNARNILENRYLPRTTDQWSEGEFRWGFTLTRNFMLFHPNKKK